MTSANVLDVLYVEDDPALRGILRAILEMSPQLRVAAAVGSSVEALAWAADNVVDVALLDLALGADDVTGVELGHRLREMQPRAGIVILSQHTVPDFVSRLPRDQQRGWSFIEKRADLRAIYLVDGPGAERHRTGCGRGSNRCRGERHRAPDQSPTTGHGAGGHRS